MTLTSFAQNQEDVMLWRALGHIRNGFYIDVGAADPNVSSVTKLFYDHGWHGINLEPDASFSDSLSAMRPHDINLRVAAAREAGSYRFYRIGGSGLSTVDAAIAARHRTAGWEVTEEIVEALPLAEICRQYCLQDPIHFLKIDVEGAEADVLAGADFRLFRPWIVLVEATLPNSQQETHGDWEPMLTASGYSFAWFDGLNRFYLADEKKDELGRHFTVQPNVFDPFQTRGDLLQRTERAERELQQFREEAAGQLRQVRDAAAQENRRIGEQASATLRDAEAVSRQAAAAVEQLASTAQAANNRSSAAMQQLQQLADTLGQSNLQAAVALAEQTRRADDAQRSALAAQHAARLANEQVTAMINSTSWRVTAPLRMVRRMQPTKQRARQAFHRTGRFLLGLPGGQRGLRLIRAIAPRPVEWLARRYRVYEQTAAMQEQAAATTPASATDLSPEEARLYRQLSTANARTTTVA
ncbi:FkbM family methyltransferase [Paraburkholderia sp. MMS20-SJTR3]|uniref:FkbM family methyltransferase n=1 Tax=Paraburkholderia sejongensis TaxID=2886946 RepID=A0ABS8JPH9_9BURK|nr:FkbM family methyltransferase [Paraburkholderia sp. MMS20-SJTR3]MCC8391804.1 FkbM family methyltransferase [Paraburkholderia sp. MMS20-SJTR3]